jgi:hypothetical protein
MTAAEFNEKWKEYLEEGFYGLAIDRPEIVEYLDNLFKDLIHLPGFSYSQIKTKFGMARVYMDGVSSTLTRTIENQIDNKMSYDLISFVERQRNFSRYTFGPPSQVDRTEGILAHIAQEIEEIRQDPKDTEEWIDIVILALDGAWRSGATPEEVVNTLNKKFVKNKARKWPDWRTLSQNDPINHES